MRIKISSKNEKQINVLKSTYKFNHDGIIPRIAFSYSLFKGKLFDLDKTENLPSDGKEFRDEKGLFGTIIGGESNFPIFKAILSQHYKRVFYDSDFNKAFKLHMNHGLDLLLNEVEINNDLHSGKHIDKLLEIVRKGLNLRNMVNTNQTSFESQIENVNVYEELLCFELGETYEGEILRIRINDLEQFDNRNIAIAGMAGSGKTQLIKDILYQIRKNTDNQLNFIFFDYKGEGNVNQLEGFLKSTNCEFVDLMNDSFNFNPLKSIITNKGDRQRVFSIKSFVDTVGMFVPNIGISQKNNLQNLMDDLFQENKDRIPSFKDLYIKLSSYYEENKLKPDSLYSTVKDLSSGLFTNDISENILEKSIYLNLPPTLSDTLRQLCVFLLLRYFNNYFSSTNDIEPKGNIFPLRYIIVIDEAHIYLKNKNASKALEELLRLMRSKGVIVVMLSQGVEDYKTKEFDFSSQVKLPICLNIQNKDYKLIKSYLGTPRSEVKLQNEINKLESGLGVVNINEPVTIKTRKFWERKI